MKIGHLATVIQLTTYIHIQLQQIICHLIINIIVIPKHSIII